MTSILLFSWIVNNMNKFTRILALFLFFEIAHCQKIGNPRKDIEILLVASSHDSVGLGPKWNIATGDISNECVYLYHSETPIRFGNHHDAGDLKRNPISIRHSQNITAILPYQVHNMQHSNTAESQQAKFFDFRSFKDGKFTHEIRYFEESETIIKGVSVDMWTFANDSNIIDKRVFWEFGDPGTTSYKDSENRAMIGTWPVGDYHLRKYGSEIDDWGLTSHEWKKSFSLDSENTISFLVDIQYGISRPRKAEIACFFAKVFTNVVPKQFTAQKITESTTEMTTHSTTEKSSTAKTVIETLTSKKENDNKNSGDLDSLWNQHNILVLVLSLVIVFCFAMCIFYAIYRLKRKIKYRRLESSESYRSLTSQTLEALGERSKPPDFTQRDVEEMTEIDLESEGDGMETFGTFVFKGDDQEHGDSSGLETVLTTTNSGQGNDEIYSHIPVLDLEKEDNPPAFDEKHTFDAKRNGTFNPQATVEMSMVESSDEDEQLQSPRGVSEYEAENQFQEMNNTLNLLAETMGKGKTE